ncbi:PaaI family thioesterase [Planococcus koreensis]|uniref:PaaI family thioesterase n=1 Tax=Planococcus koreensis TaxID=112331 RepID=UPI0039FDBB55
MADNNRGRLDELQKELAALDQKELDEVAYVLSLYGESSRVSRPDIVPMHFLGRFLGIEQHADGTAEMKLGAQNENTYGVAQGGAVYTLADVAIGFSILKTLEEGEKVFTLELKVNFIEKGQGAHLLAVPVILRRGRSTVAAECTVTDDNGTLVAKALGTFYISGRK